MNVWEVDLRSVADARAYIVAETSEQAQEVVARDWGMEVLDAFGMEPEFTASVWRKPLTKELDDSASVFALVDGEWEWTDGITFKERERLEKERRHRQELAEVFGGSAEPVGHIPGQETLLS